MSKKIVEVKNVSIIYKLGDFKYIGLKEWVLRHIKHEYHVETFEAISNVSFDIYEGDMLGIVGTNGAGKSTLLKAITGVMCPSKGEIKVDGKISALLELASGFDDELNLKENTYLRGSLLGFSRAFVDEKYDEIIEFSGLKEFENRAFKQLSSGMKSRIAFAIVSTLKPEILILDEVLSVGDGAFQEKSFKRMMEIIESGSTSILVSHDLKQIRNLCNKVLWIERGKMIAFGDNTEEICDRYQHFLDTGVIE